jgi:hypothetical protein
VWTAALDPATEGILKLKNWNKINKDAFSTSQELYCMDINLLQSHQEYKCNNVKVTKSAVTYVSFICKVFISFDCSLILSGTDLMEAVSNSSAWAV